MNEALGEEHASTPLAALPAHDWHDLRRRVEIENVEHRILTALHRELTIQTRIYVLALITTGIALSSVAVFTG